MLLALELDWCRRGNCVESVERRTSALAVYSAMTVTEAAL